MLENVKSLYISEMLFQYLKNKRKLKIIKYNKKMQNKLKITKKDFQAYKSLKEFNEQFLTNIEDIDIKELNLGKKYFGDEGLNLLGEIKFINLKSLNLELNEILI